MIKSTWLQDVPTIGGAIATNRWNTVYVTDTKILYLIPSKLGKHFRVFWQYQALKRADQCYKDYNHFEYTNFFLSHNGIVKRRAFLISSKDLKNEV